LSLRSPSAKWVLPKASRRPCKNDSNQNGHHWRLNDVKFELARPAYNPIRAGVRLVAGAAILSALAVGVACDGQNSLAEEGARVDGGRADSSAAATDAAPRLDFDVLFVERDPEPWPGSPDSERPPPEPCDPDAGINEPPDTNDELFGLDGCRPAPARLVVLGDSVASMGGDSPMYHQRLMQAGDPLQLMRIRAHASASAPPP
jgi:hypothetical protein